MPKNPPEPMLRKGRPADQHFNAEERLFRRIPPNCVLPEEKIDLRAIELPDISVNREKHEGIPEYVLYGMFHGKPRHFKNWGIAAISAGGIPPEIESDGMTYLFMPVHRPEEHNYYHSEIQCHSQNGEHVDPTQQIARESQLLWRKKLQAQMTMIKRADS